MGAYTFTFSPLDYNTTWVGSGPYPAAATFYAGVSDASVVLRSFFEYDLSALRGWRVLGSTMLWTCQTGANSAELFDVHQITQTGFVPATADWEQYDGANNWASAGGDYATALVASYLTLPIALGEVTTITGDWWREFCQQAIDKYAGRLMGLVKRTDEGVGVKSRTNWYSDHTGVAAVRPTLTIEATPNSRAAADRTLARLGGGDTTDVAATGAAGVYRCRRRGGL